MTLAGLADDCRRFGDDLAAAVLPRAGPRMRAATIAAAGARRMMGAAIDADVTPRGDMLAVLPTPVGAWSVLEAGSHKRGWWEPAHPGPRSRRLTIGRDVRVRVRHGPLRGRRAWTHAQAAMADVFVAVAHAEASRLWRAAGG